MAQKINKDYNLQFMTWVAPMTFTDKNFPGLLTADSRGYMDLTNPDALKEFENRLSTNQYTVGVKGHKMDRADENFPLTASWYQPAGESVARNKYIYLYSRVIDDFLSQAHGKTSRTLRGPLIIAVSLILVQSGEATAVRTGWAWQAARLMPCAADTWVFPSGARIQADTWDRAVSMKLIYTLAAVGCLEWNV